MDRDFTTEEAFGIWKLLLKTGMVAEKAEGKVVYVGAGMDEGEAGGNRKRKNDDGEERDGEKRIKIVPVSLEEIAAHPVETLRRALPMSVLAEVLSLSLDENVSAVADQRRTSNAFNDAVTWKIYHSYLRRSGLLEGVPIASLEGGVMTREEWRKNLRNVYANAAACYNVLYATERAATVSHRDALASSEGMGSFMASFGVREADGGITRHQNSEESPVDAAVRIMETVFADRFGPAVNRLASTPSSSPDATKHLRDMQNLLAFRTRDGRFDRALQRGLFAKRVHAPGARSRSDWGTEPTPGWLAENFFRLPDHLGVRALAILSAKNYAEAMGDALLTGRERFHERRSKGDDGDDFFADACLDVYLTHVMMLACLATLVFANFKDARGASLRTNADAADREKENPFVKAETVMANHRSDLGQDLRLWGPASLKKRAGAWDATDPARSAALTFCAWEQLFQVLFTPSKNWAFLDRSYVRKFNYHLAEAWLVSSVPVSIEAWMIPTYYDPDWTNEKGEVEDRSTLQVHELLDSTVEHRLPPPYPAGKKILSLVVTKLLGTVTLNAETVEIGFEVDGPFEVRNTAPGVLLGPDVQTLAVRILSPQQAMESVFAAVLGPAEGAVVPESHYKGREGKLTLSVRNEDVGHHSYLPRATELTRWIGGAYDSVFSKYSFRASQGRDNNYPYGASKPNDPDTRDSSHFYPTYGYVMDWLKFVRSLERKRCPVVLDIGGDRALRGASREGSPTSHLEELWNTPYTFYHFDHEVVVRQSPHEYPLRLDAEALRPVLNHERPVLNLSVDFSVGRPSADPREAEAFGEANADCMLLALEAREFVLKKLKKYCDRGDTAAEARRDLDRHKFLKFHYELTSKPLAPKDAHVACAKVWANRRARELALEMHEFVAECYSSIFSDPRKMLPELNRISGLFIGEIRPREYFEREPTPENVLEALGLW